MITFPSTMQQSGYTATKSLDFDGVNDTVLISDNNAYSFGDSLTDSPFSVSFWFKPASLGTGIGGVVSKWSTEWQIIMDYTNNRMYADLADGSSSVTASRFIAAGFWTGKYDAWHHVVLTYNGTGGSTAGTGMTFYVDNINETDVQVTSPSYVAMQNGTDAVVIGGATTNYFAGRVTNVSIWNKALSTSEISEIYNSGKPNDLAGHSASANLVSWWKLGDADTYPTMTDQQGVANGTMTNMNSGDIFNDAP